MEEKKVISINHPPKDGKCDCCHKHVSELKPFGKEGDPLAGNFDGKLLVKLFRSMAPINEKAEAKIESIKDWDQFYKDNGEEAKNLDFYQQLRDTVEPSWECRECILLDTEGYFKLLYSARREEEMRMLTEKAHDNIDYELLINEGLSPNDAAKYWMLHHKQLEEEDAGTGKHGPVHGEIAHPEPYKEEE